MGIDRNKYIDKYVDEGLENIAAVEALLFEAREGGSIDDDLATLLRALHTLKGSSRMLDFKRVESLSHALESVFVAVKEQRVSLSDSAMRLTLAALDTLKLGLGMARRRKDDAIDIRAFEKELAALAENEEFLIPVSPHSAADGLTAGMADGMADGMAAGMAAGFEGAAMPSAMPPDAEGEAPVAEGAERKPEYGPGAYQAGGLANGKTAAPAGMVDNLAGGDPGAGAEAAQTPSGETGGGEAGNPLVLSRRAAGRKREAPEVQGRPRQVAKREKQDSLKAESIRISLEKIDQIIKNTASLQSLEIAAKTIAMEMEAVNELAKQFSRSLKTARQADQSLGAEFQRLEQRIGKTASSLKNYSIDTGNHTKGVYESVISLRMLPIATILDAYPRYVFETAAELGKKVRLALEGNETEIDKNIIETLSDVFLHMVRNAIDHGIEPPAERLLRGKDETGLISIRCSRESGNMKILIADDGRGIDHEAIRKKIAGQGLLTQDGAASLSQEDLVNYIFQSGFSTSPAVSALSGRGVGMDAVRSSIEHLKGSIMVETKAGAGTAFTILVPLSIASLMGFPVTCGDMKFIIPANFVDTILLIKREDIITVVDRPGIKFETSIIKLYYLSQILKIKMPGEQGEPETLFVVVIHAYDDVIALAVDRISSMRSVILKSMPSFMEALPVFSGVVLSEDYEIVPALHMPALIRMAKQTKAVDMKRRHIEYERMRKSILVVDDSLPTREIEGEILQAEGYKVDTAADGSEALQSAKANHYDLICTDLNMPIMDGFLLTENIRKNDELSRIPIIVISSKANEADQKRAALLGANRYIIKNSFNNHNLLTAVRELIGEANA
ncbi:MAG: response regulator [Treponema sp.]|jgi:chemotaxis protein histidine kinase CheA|nr:response regulator [Treponema sp.]